jgi:hypothetical protein
VVRRSAPAVDPAEAADADLFIVRPEDFVASRNALVKKLKAVGERERAAKVAALRRPSVVDWALNTVAVEHADVIERFLDAATAAREAQAAAVEGRQGDDLRTAVGKLREATVRVGRLASEVLDGSGKASSAQASAVTSRLAVIAANPALGDQLHRRQLGSGAADAADLFAGLEPASAGTRKPVAPPRKVKAPVTPQKDVPDRRELARVLAAAKRTQSSAQAAAHRASARLRRAKADVSAAEKRLAKAQREYSAAEAEHEKRAEAVEAASRAVADAQARF